VSVARLGPQRAPAGDRVLFPPGGLAAEPAGALDRSGAAHRLELGWCWRWGLYHPNWASSPSPAA